LKAFVNAENPVQLEAGTGQRVDQTINETPSAKENFTSSITLTVHQSHEW
jgi:filamentous hemagglutinin